MATEPPPPEFEAPPRSPWRSSPKHALGRAILVASVLIAAAIFVHANHLVFDVVDANADLRSHYLWSLQFSEAFANGDNYPRWMPLGNGGLGEPFALYYSPLFFYAVALMDLAVGRTGLSIQLVEIASTAVAGLFAWLTLRRLTDARLALLGAVVVQCAPFVFMLFHYFNGLPWASSVGAYLASTFFLVRYIQLDRKGLDFGIAVAVAALALTHLVSAFVGLIASGLALLIFYWTTTRRVTLTLTRTSTWALSACLGLALAGFYLYPALTSLDLVSAQGWSRYDPRVGFAFPTVTAYLFGVWWFAFQWVVPIVVGLCVLSASLYMWRSGTDYLGTEKGKIFKLLLALSLVSLFFASELSYPFWLADTPLLQVQFPFRFIYLTTPIAIYMVIIALDDAYRRNTQWHVKMLLGGPLALSLLLCLALAAKLVLTGEDSHQSLLETKEPYTSFPEYVLPGQSAETLKYVTDGALAKECETLNADCQAANEPRANYAWIIDSSAPVRLRLPVLWFPSWRVEVDGRSTAPATKDGATGLVAVDVPAGRSLIRLHWHRLPQETIGAAISLAALLLILMLLAASYTKHQRKRSNQT